MLNLVLQEKHFKGQSKPFRKIMKDKTTYER